MKKALLPALIALACSGAAGAADLLAVYRDAVANDQVFAAAQASQIAGQEKMPQGRAGLLPTVSASASTTWNDLDSKSRTPNAATRAAEYNSHAWSIQLSQPLFRWQNWVQYKQGELAVAQADLQFGLARQDLIVRVAQAYFDVLLAQEALATARAQKVAIAEQLESAKRNFEVGTATITDTHEAQSRYDLATAVEIAADNDLTVKRQVLRSVTGKEPDGLKALKPGIQLGRPQPDSMVTWVQSAEEGALTVQVGQVALENADREIEKQRAGHYPTLDLVAARSRSSQTASLNFGVPGPGSDLNSRTIGLQLAIPIFAGGAVMSRDREAVALREKSLADLENARRQAALAARQAYLGVTSGLAQVKAYEAAVVSSQSALESNKLGYEVGVRINIDVLNAQSQLYDTRQKLVKARLDTLAALLKLKAAAGTLSEDDVVAVNALLE
ncbi:MAG: TolC family outer membrane protein [Rhodocyclaceae bacterium]|nr:TolC family outer membrane protein [Rhodocyclaceae bacterium]